MCPLSPICCDAEHMWYDSSEGLPLLQEVSDMEEASHRSVGMRWRLALPVIKECSELRVRNILAMTDAAFLTLTNNNVTWVTDVMKQAISSFR